MAFNIQISVILLLCGLVFVEFRSHAHTMNLQKMDDNCVLSFVVPRDKMKSSCNVEEKFRRRMSAVEMKVNVYKHQMNELQTMLTKERELNAQKIENLEKRARESSLNGDSHVLLERRLALLEQEVGQLSNEIVQGRSVHSHNRNAIEDHPDYNFNALDQNPVTLPNLVKSMVKAELQSAMDDYTEKFEKYVKEQMLIYSKINSMMAQTRTKTGLHGEGRLNGNAATHVKYQETISRRIENQLNEFRNNIDKTGEEIAKNVNSYLQDTHPSGVKNHQEKDVTKHDGSENKYHTIQEKDRTNMITTTSTTKTTTTATTQSATDKYAAKTNAINDAGKVNTTSVEYEGFQLLNTSEIVITEDTSLDVNDSFSGENPDSKETSTKPMVLTRRTDAEIAGGASSRISGGGGAASETVQKKYEEEMKWKENMVMDQAQAEEKLMEKVKILLYQPMAEMMSLVEKQNAQINDKIQSLQEEVTHKLVKDFNARLKSADQGVDRNTIQIESVSQAVQDLYVKMDKLKTLEIAVNGLKENATAVQNDMPMTVNEHGKRMKKLERLMGVYRQSFDHYKNETKQEYKKMRERLLKETISVKIISKTLQKNITGTVTKMIDRYNESQSAQMEEMKNKMRGQEENVMFCKIDLADLQRKVNSRSNKFDKELKEIRENVDQFSRRSRDLKRKTDSINRKFSVLEQKVNSTTKNISDLKTEVKLSMTDSWLQIDFDFDGLRSGCFGKQYVKKSKFTNGTFVGVVLCSPERYKILLSDTLDGKFLNIGDGDGLGRDHCEFVGGSRDNKITLAPYQPTYGSDKGYFRNDWGQEPVIDKINAVRPTSKWYECGVTIP